MKVKTTLRNIVLSRICSRPDHTIRVWGYRVVQQFTYKSSKLKHLRSLTKTIKKGNHPGRPVESIRSMCYVRQCDTVIAIAACPDMTDVFDIWGIIWGTGCVASK